MRTIAIGSDKFGFKLKETIKAHLEEQGNKVIDFGPESEEKAGSYVTVAHNVALSVQSGESDRAVVICTTGMGVSLVTNKHRGVYCALCESLWTAIRCRVINNANVLAMGAGVVGDKMAVAMVDAFMETEFAGGEAPGREEVLQGFLDEFKKVEDEMFEN